MTIREALEGWYIHLRSKRVSPGTLDRYQRVWRQFSAWLSEQGITEIEQLKGRATPASSS